MSFKLLFIIIFVSILLSAGLLGYRLFYQAPKSADAAAGSQSGVVAQGLFKTGAGQPTDPDEAEYARLLRVIESIDKLDSSIFTSKVLLSLINFPSNVPNLVPGRPNPFAPVGLP